MVVVVFGMSSAGCHRSHLRDAVGSTDAGIDDLVLLARTEKLPWTPVPMSGHDVTLRVTVCAFDELAPCACRAPPARCRPATAAEEGGGPRSLRDRPDGPGTWAALSEA